METNFAGLTPYQKLCWARETWSAARDQMFLKNFSGKDANNVVHIIKDLTKTEKGESAIFQLVADLVGDGVVGARSLLGKARYPPQGHGRLQSGCTPGLCSERFSRGQLPGQAPLWRPAAGPATG